MQLPPSPALTGIVKHYLLLQSDVNIAVNYRLISDGNPGIVFHFKDSFVQYPSAFLYGQITSYKDIQSTGKLGMLVVVLQPHGIYSLLGLSACELNNCIINLADIYGNEISERVSNATNTRDRINIVERFLYSKHETDDLFKESLHNIYRNQGNITIQDLLKKVPVTERQLERKFKLYTGISPKKYIDIIRFQHFLKLLRSGSQKISDAAYDGGYYDQSHLNNYFKKITGITPSQYKHDHHLLALNFMQLS